MQPRYYSVSKNNSQRWVALSPNPHPQLCPVDPYLRSRCSPNLKCPWQRCHLPAGVISLPMAGEHILSLTKGAQRAGGTLVSWPAGLAAHPSRLCWGCGSLGLSHDSEAPVGGRGRALGEVEKASTGGRTGNGRPGTCG